MEPKLQNMNDCPPSSLEKGHADPVRSQLHQAARGLKAVRSLACQAGGPASEGVLHCLAQVNLQLDTLCRQLKELDGNEIGATWQPVNLTSTLLSGDTGSRQSDKKPLTGNTNVSPGIMARGAAASRPSGSPTTTPTGSPTILQPVAGQADRDNPVPATNYPGDDTAPSLHAILARLNSPADVVFANPPVGQRVKSLSDEDLLGLEMLNLVSAGISESGSRNSPSTAEAGSFAVKSQSPDSLSDVEELETPVSEQEELAVELSGQPVDSGSLPTENGRNVAESLYETALSGDSSLFSIEAVDDSAGAKTHGNDPGFSSRSTRENGSPPASETRLNPAVVGDEPDSADTFQVNSVNVEKLKALRQRLQGIFACQNPDSSISPELTIGSAEDSGCTRQPNPLPPNTLKTEHDSKKGGDPMQSTQTNTPRKENGGLMAGMATAALFKSLNLEDDEPAATPQAPSGDSPGQAGQSSAVAGTAPTTPEPQAVPGDVDDYMKQLFHRLRGGEAPVPLQKSTKQNVTRIDQPAAGKPPTAPAVQENPSEPVVPLKEGEFVPISESDIQNLNISALRELANQSTRSAIKVFNRHQKKSMYITQLAGVCAGIVGAVCFSSLAPGLGSMFYLMSVASAGLSVFAGYSFFMSNISRGAIQR